MDATDTLEIRAKHKLRGALAYDPDNLEATLHYVKKHDARWAHMSVEELEGECWKALERVFGGFSEEHVKKFVGTLESLYGAYYEIRPYSNVTPTGAAVFGTGWAYELRFFVKPGRDSVTAPLAPQEDESA